MKKARGYEIITDPAFGMAEEHDTFTCCHCGYVQRKKPFQSHTDGAIGAWCTCCDAPMCLNCVGKGCQPLERKLEIWERRRQNEEIL